MLFMRHCKFLSDITLYAWRQCNEKLDLRFTRVGYEVDDTEIIPDDITAFNELNADLIDNYQGIPATTVDLLELGNKLAKAKLDLFLTGEAIHMNFIRLYENKIKNLKEEIGEGMTFDDLINALEGWRKFHLDEHKITAGRFYALIDKYKSYCAEQEKLSNKNKVM